MAARIDLVPRGSSDAAACIRRTLRAATFPDAGHDYALSVVIAAEQPSSALPAATGDTQEYGMVGLLNSGDTSSATGNMWGSEIGDAYGEGGLGMTGVGEGGGGRGEGIGLGTIGAAGAGAGPGFGSGGRLGGAHRAKSPSVKMGNSVVTGRLPPEVVQRIVRQNFGRFRLCYEQGLKKNPKLAGLVTVVFEIGRDGSVKSTSSTTDLKDKAVATCVQRAFGNLSFPQPEGGVVKVTYPIRFSPGDEAPSPAATPEVPSPPRTIHGKAVASATLADVERRLAELKLPVVEVPGFALGQSPALFVRDSSSKVFALSFGPGRDGLSGVRCVAGTPERTLYVWGDGCHRVMGSLLD